MNARYAHTCIIAEDWKALAAFYETVFGCVREPRESDLSGGWLDKGTGVKDARLRGVKLSLPGFGGAGGPSLEIFQYARSEEKHPPKANRKGFGHIAFEVDEVRRALSEVVAHGGRALGEVSSRKVAGQGTFAFVFACDPEGNIVELMKWEPVLRPA